VTASATATGPIALALAPGLTNVLSSAPPVVVGPGQKVIIMTTADYQSVDPTGTSASVGQQIVDQVPNIYDTAVQTVFSTTTIGGLSPSAEVMGRVVEVVPLAPSPVTFTIQASQIPATPAVTANNVSIVVMVVSV
jgi:hypothetical protein